VRHSIISWDCCYRNFFHTAQALAEQEFDIDAFEVIYVEQRTMTASDAFSRSLGLAALGDVVKTLEGRINIRALYLGDGPNVPFHWGRAVNAGIEASRGEIISVMDGDLLVQPNFLSKLDNEHRRVPKSVVNLHRRMVPAPIGVSRDRWTEQQVSFSTCLDACPDRDQPPPERPNNYGPMISARREHWAAINGYDEHPIWGSGLSLLGTDVTRRLEIEVGVTSHLLPDTVCVHPWHPVGFQRHTLAARRILSLQERLVEWSLSNKMSDWRDRLAFANAVYGANRRFVDNVMASDVAQPSVTPNRSSRMKAWTSGFAARLVNGEFREIRGDVRRALRTALPRRR
jgi:hypothetical protein